ncbi:RNA-protein complex protein Nop10 [Candidatus Woesearchaeota archaeon]|nr:RNA-protein complex protein Nop10 [Candidatus Woesearchaeota archaeon]
MKHILKCQKCENFTMNETCRCGEEAITTKPPRYSPDKYAKYRRQARKEELQKKGLL